MVKYFLIIFCAFSTFFVFSQEQEKDTTTNEIISFEIIEEPPIFPGCEELEINLQKNCLQNQIQKHVAMKFNTGLANNLGLPRGKIKITSEFHINEDGVVEDIVVTAPHEELKEEAIKVVKSLPRMIPAKKDGKAVKVKYILPVT